MRRGACCFLFVLSGYCAFDVLQCAECDPNRCRLEDNCLCANNGPPGNLTVAEMPQFVMLTFDDAVNERAMKFFRVLLAPGRRRNRANGCNAAATFFVSAGYTDYSFVHELHSVGSEIALHSITHLDNITYWRTLDVAGWEAEFLGIRQLLRDYALIPEENMVGARAPFLEIGPGDGYAMMWSHGILYDSSVYVRLCNATSHRGITAMDVIFLRRKSPGKPPRYPYTLDYGVCSDCDNIVCPRGAFKGLWMVPMNRFVRSALGDDGAGIEDVCPMPDACRPKPTTAVDMFDFLRTNFERHYRTNRAPFPVFIHEDWLWQPQRKRGFLSFVDWLLAKEDVFLVTVEEVVRCMRDPKLLGKYVQRKCSTNIEFQQCPEIHTCHFPGSPIPQTKHLVGCKPCPERYPWIEDAKLLRTNDRTGRSEAKQSYGAMHVVLLCSALLFCLFIVAKLSTRVCGLGRQKRRNIV